MKDNIRIQIKELQGKQWAPVDLKDLKGKSTLSFIVGREFPVVAAVFEEDKPVMFISNSEQEVVKYKAKAPSFYASDLQEIISSELIAGETVKAIEAFFGECKYVELSLNPKKEEQPKNNIYKPNVSKLLYPSKEEQSELF